MVVAIITDRDGHVFAVIESCPNFDIDKIQEYLAGVFEVDKVLLESFPATCDNGMLNQLNYTYYIEKKQYGIIEFLITKDL